MATAIARRSATGFCCYLLRYNNTPTSFFCKSNFVSPSISRQLLHFSSSNSKQTSSDKPHTLVPDFFIHKYHFSPQVASKISSVSVTMINPLNSDLVLSFLKNNGFSNPQLEKIMRREPKLVSYSIEKTIKPKLKILQDLGLSTGEIAEIVANNRSILLHREEKTIQSMSVLKGLLGSKGLVKVLKRGSDCFFADVEKNLLPNIEFLKSYGVQMEQIISCIHNFPNLFTVKPKTFRKYVHKVDEMRVDRTSKAFMYAVNAVGSMSNEKWELKLKSFHDLGFSADDILSVFRRTPMVLTVSTWKIKEVKEALLETGKYDMSCIINYPQALICSVEKRYKPRLQVLKVLEKRNLIKKWPALSTLVGYTNEEFFKRFVAPNMKEVGEVFIAKTAVSGKPEVK